MQRRTRGAADRAVAGAATGLMHDCSFEVDLAGLL